MAQITLERVTKKFKERVDPLSRVWGGKPPPPREGEEDRPGVAALDNMDLVIKDGETVALVGPSGSGKSTLLRVVAGLEHPDSGRVLYDGKDMAEVPPKDRGIGMVFQNYALYPHMESRMNLGFYFMVRKREKEIPERVKITADIMGVGFGELMERKPKQLSGGQQQRVAIGRCIVRDPSLFLLDEPLSNLDAKLRVRTRVEIKRLLRRFAITTLYVTHDQVEAIALGDRIAVMDKGKVEQIGSYRDVHDRPVNVFVATFIGIPPMNILEATASRDGRELQFGQSSVATPEGWQVTPGAKVLLGVRAEDVAADAAQPDVYVDVDVVEPLVQERMQLVHGLVGDTHFVAKVPGEPEVRRGDRLPLRFQPALVHLFDAATHARLPQA